MKKLPLAISEFPELIEDSYIYVDKTQQMYEMVNYSKYVFLSRPRRFGKSLLVSTLEAFFRGRKELFKGLWIEDKVNWEKYPVLRVDFGKSNYASIEDFKLQMAEVLDNCAAQYEVSLTSFHFNSKLDELLRKIHQKTGKRTSVLIDEYDAPIARHITDIGLATKYHDTLRDFYSILKASSKHIKFVFMTGISKFAKMSIFSVINLMKDISLLPKFNNILGFTAEELQTHFGKHISDFARNQHTSEQQLLQELTNWYDGYKWEGSDNIFNPYSVVNALQDQEFNNYWFETGTPAILMKLIKEKYAVERETLPTLEEFENIETVNLRGSYDLRESIPLSKLLFETGYLTVKKLERIIHDKLYTLGYPNYEVRYSFNAFILSAFSNQTKDIIQSKGTLMKRALLQEDKENFLTLLRSLFAALPYYHRSQASEAYYHGLFYLIMTLLGVTPNLEEATDKGRIDCVLPLEEKIYIIEFKYGEKGTMDYLLKQAMNQINKHQYFESFEGSNKKIWLLGVGFLVKYDAELKKDVLTIDADLKFHS